MGFSISGSWRTQKHSAGKLNNVWHLHCVPSMVHLVLRVSHVQLCVAEFGNVQADLTPSLLTKVDQKNNRTQSKPPLDWRQILKDLNSDHTGRKRVKEGEC